MKNIIQESKFIENKHLFSKEIYDTQNQKGAIVVKNTGMAYKTALEYTSDKVIARYLDYEGNPVDYNGEIIFEFEGEQQIVKALNGVAEIPFVVVDPGVYVVRTANPDVENGEVIINA